MNTSYIHPLSVNSEPGFVFASLMEFMKAWESGANSRLFLESVNGSAFVSFGCFLGPPAEMHFNPKKKEKSKKKKERDNLRAASFQAAMKKNEGNPSQTNDASESGGQPPNEDMVMTLILHVMRIMRTILSM